MKDAGHQHEIKRKASKGNAKFKKNQEDMHLGEIKAVYSEGQRLNIQVKSKYD